MTFDYGSADPDNKVVLSEISDGVRVDTIEFDGSEALLCSPLDDRSGLPGVVFAGQGGVKDRFLADGIATARTGAIALLPLTNFGLTGDPDEDLAMVLRAASTQQKAVALLLHHDRVAEDRLAFVGHGWGATQAAIVAHQDAPLKTLILAGTGARVSEFFWEYGPRTANRKDYVNRLATVDPVHTLAGYDRAPTLMQVGSHDQNVPPAEGEELWAALAGDKTRIDYDCDHNLVDHKPAQTDRLRWLKDKLAL